ncbi:MAG TPA: transposase [Edaphobacter sp.]
MDTSQQATFPNRDKAATVVVQRRQRWSIAEKRRMVEETLVPGASVARVARTEGVNSNQLFGWRRLYLAGRLGQPKPGVKLLPVRVSESLATPVAVEHRGMDFPKPPSGTIHLELRHAKVRIEGSADPGLVRVLLECLQA